MADSGQVRPPGVGHERVQDVAAGKGERAPQAEIVGGVGRGGRVDDGPALASAAGADHVDRPFVGMAETAVDVALGHLGSPSSEAPWSLSWDSTTGGAA